MEKGTGKRVPVVALSSRTPLSWPPLPFSTHLNSGFNHNLEKSLCAVTAARRKCAELLRSLSPQPAKQRTLSQQA